MVAFFIFKNNNVDNNVRPPNRAIKLIVGFYNTPRPRGKNMVLVASGVLVLRPGCFARRQLSGRKKFHQYRNRVIPDSNDVTSTS
jgi:hypothetical protein